jgi:hypothetical protein
MTNGITMVGDWQAECKNALRNALRASVEISGRTGIEACKHAIILMAQSARALTKQSPKNRKVEHDPRFRGKAGEFIRIFRQNKSESRFFRFHFKDNSEWQTARRIANRGLAKRSWMWGLKNLNKTIDSKEIPGVGSLIKIQTEKVVGYILKNALSYLKKALPSGWEYVVVQKAANKIMHNARKKIENDFMRERRGTWRKGFVGGFGLNKFFLKA